MVNISKFVKDNDIELSIRYDDDANEYVVTMTRYPIKIERRIIRGFEAQDVVDIEFERTLRGMLSQINEQHYCFRRKSHEGDSNV